MHQASTQYMDKPSVNDSVSVAKELRLISRVTSFSCKTVNPEHLFTNCVIQRTCVGI